MARPSKPVSVLVAEGKSHRTKAELASREQQEKSMLTGTSLSERKEVRSNPTAHAEFRRIVKLMSAIGKNDALYSASVNTYCQLYAEIRDAEIRRACLAALLDRTCAMTERADNLEQVEKMLSQVTRLSKEINALEAGVDKKRRLMLAIDKENVMTVSAALRAIPKKPPNENNPLLDALNLED